MLFSCHQLYYLYTYAKELTKDLRCPIKNNSDFLIQQSEITSLYHRQSIDNIYKKGLSGFESNYLSESKLKSSSVL